MSDLACQLRAAADSLDRGETIPTSEAMAEELAAMTGRKLAEIPMAVFHTRARVDCLILQSVFGKEFSHVVQATIVTIVHYGGIKSNQQLRIAKGGMDEVNGPALERYALMTPDERLQRAKELKAVYDDSLRSSPKRLPVGK